MPQTSRRAIREVQAGVGTAVWLGVTTAILLFAILTIASTWMRGRDDRREAAAPRPASAPREVDVWVGELAPDVKGVLSADSSQAEWDEAQDVILNRGLGLEGEGHLAFYTLVIFNTSGKPVSLTLGDGDLVVTPKSGAPVASRSLASVLSPPAAGAASSQATTLRLLGAAEDKLELPSGRMVRRPIAFPRRVSLADALAVNRRDGTAFHARRMSRPQWAGLLHSPSVADLRDL